MGKILQIFVGLIFLVSGILKGIDPYGTALKIQEYSKVVAIGLSDNGSMTLSVLLCGFEIFIGVMLLSFLYRKFFVIITLVVLGLFSITMLFFLILPSYDIKECGCFGELLPMTTSESLLKNIILLAMACYILARLKIQKHDSKRSVITLSFIVIASFVLPFISALNLPIIDLSDYALGTNIKNINEFAVYDENSVNVKDSLLDANNKQIFLVLKDVLQKRELNKITDIYGENAGNVYALAQKEVQLPKTVEIYFCKEMLLKKLIRSYKNAVIIIENGIIKDKYIIN